MTSEAKLAVSASTSKLGIAKEPPKKPTTKIKDNTINMRATAEDDEVEYEVEEVIRKTTRRTIDTKTREEIEYETGQDIMDATQGKMYLDRHLLTIPGQAFTMENIITALFQITQFKSITRDKQATNALRAVAFALQDIDIDDKAADLHNLIQLSINEQIEHYKETTYVSE